MTLSLKALPVLIVLLSCCANAQEAEIAEVSRVPLQQMQKLAVLAGNWNMTVFITEDAGRTWVPTPQQSVEIEYVHKGFMLEEIPQDLDSPGFHMHTFLTHDQYRNVFRKAALDDVWGIFDLYQGSITNNRLVLDNLAAKTFFPLGDNVWRGFRLTIELKPDHRFMYIDKTDDDGNTWQPAFKAEYERT